MVAVPRFIEHDGKVALIFATYKEGVIETVSNPVQLIAEGSHLDLIKTVDELLSTALHTAPILTLTDLPESARARFVRRPVGEA